MVEIFDGIRYDLASGDAELHRGTKEYLYRRGANLVEKSGRDVPDSHVDADGSYLKEEGDDD